MPSRPITISGERSTHSPTTVSGPDAQAAQMMRQPVGVGVERGVAQRAVLEHHRDRIRRAHSLRGKQRRQGRGRQPRCAVSFQPRRMVSRSAALQDLRLPSARSGVRNRGLQQPDQARRPIASTSARSNRSGR